MKCSVIISMTRSQLFSDRKTVVLPRYEGAALIGHVPLKDLASYRFG